MLDLECYESESHQWEEVGFPSTEMQYTCAYGDMDTRFDGTCRNSCFENPLYGFETELQVRIPPVIPLLEFTVDPISKKHVNSHP